MTEDTRLENIAFYNGMVKSWRNAIIDMAPRANTNWNWEPHINHALDELLNAQSKLTYYTATKIKK